MTSLCEARADCCKSTATSKHTTSTTCTISTEFTRQSTTNCILAQTRTPTAALALGSRAVVSWQQQDSARVYSAVIFPVPFTSYMWPHLTILRRIVLVAGTSESIRTSEQTRNAILLAAYTQLRATRLYPRAEAPKWCPEELHSARATPLECDRQISTWDRRGHTPFHIHSTLSPDSLPSVGII